MQKLIGKIYTEQRGGLNPKTLYVYENESGTVGYRYTDKRGTRFAVSNIQVGWRGPELPDCVYDYKSPMHLMRAAVKAVNGGVVTAVDKKTYIKEFQFN
mgnify:CR=1 FL=1